MGETLEVIWSNPIILQKKELGLRKWSPKSKAKREEHSRKEKQLEQKQWFKKRCAQGLNFHNDLTWLQMPEKLTVNLKGKSLGPTYRRIWMPMLSLFFFLNFIKQTKVSDNKPLEPIFHDDQLMASLIPFMPPLPPSFPSPQIILKQT